MAGTLARQPSGASPCTLALPVWLANYFVWHVPAVYDAALERQDWLIHLSTRATSRPGS
jgi:hypothetical protein